MYFAPLNCRNCTLLSQKRPHTFAASYEYIILI